MCAVVLVGLCKFGMPLVWIPAYAGMTVRDVGMMMDAGMTVKDAGMTVKDARNDGCGICYRSGGAYICPPFSHRSFRPLRGSPMPFVPMFRSYISP